MPVAAACVRRIGSRCRGPVRSSRSPTRRLGHSRGAPEDVLAAASRRRIESAVRLMQRVSQGRVVLGASARQRRAGRGLGPTYVGVASCSGCVCPIWALRRRLQR